MAYNYATKDSNLYDEKLTQGLLTGGLDTPSVDWLNAKSFRVRSVATSGLQMHTRNKGYNPGVVTQEDLVYTLGFDRDIEFYVDTMDVDETNQELAAARITGEFIEKQATPEVDAYRFSKLATVADNEGNLTAYTPTAATVFDKAKDLILPVRKYGPQNVMMWVSTAFMDSLERSTAFTRTIEVKGVNPAGLETRVTSIDGVQLFEVWDDDRFGTEFDFTDGFQLTGTKLNALVVAKPAVIAKVKHNSVYLHAPGSVGQGDGWLYQYRIYHDLWVLNKQLDGVHGVTA